MGVKVMAYPKGGRADKYGNRFEYNWSINMLLDVIEEEISYIILEDIGDNEQGIDLWVCNKDGSMEGQQCKGRNASKENWTFSDASNHNIFVNWKKHLDSNETNSVSLVSPISFTLLEDLTNASRNTDLQKPQSFVDKQVFGNGTGKITKKLFSDICRDMEIDYNTPSGKIKAQNYFSRMYYRQYQDSTLKDLVLKRIDVLFANDKHEVYSKLLELILTEDVLGKQIDIVLINKYIEDAGIRYLDLAKDDRIAPMIRKLNQEYHRSFVPLLNGLIRRQSSEDCEKAITLGESLVIHGSAGNGKTGCTENIIKYCIENDIPYLALKLDKHVPEYNSRKWGESLGLPASIVHCLHAISDSRSSVLLLDQLDALRWTQAHTGDSLSICAEIIAEVVNINLRRKYPMSIVFVCRTYDLENDRSIKSLFESKNSDDIKWNKVHIGTLSQETVKEIIGPRYDSLSTKQQQLLSVISNLYIWEQLENKDDCMEFKTTYELIHEWWEQIVSRANRQNINTDKLSEVRDRINSFIDTNGRLFVPAPVIGVSATYLEFLKSNGFITTENNQIAFVHQSISDCFLSDIMIQKYYNDNSIIQIIGEKEKQTPSRRYQAQLFMQQLAEYDINNFLSIGNAMLMEQNIRYNLKFVFLEVISQINKEDKCLFEYLIKMLENPEWKNHFLNTVIHGRTKYVRYFLEEGYLEKWMENSEEQETVIHLMSSIAPNYDEKDLQFIKKYALNGDERWFECFYPRIYEGSDEYFELRLQFYRIYPARMQNYINLKEMMENCEIRTVRLLALMLELSIRKGEDNLYKYSEEMIDDENDISIADYHAILQYMLPLLPDKEEVNIEFSDWSLYSEHHRSLERVCTNVIKKALHQCAVDNSDLLIEILTPYLGCGNGYYNELILDSFRYLPSEKSDFVIKYLISDFNKTGFESTSGNKNKLLLLQKVISKHSALCSDSLYTQLENAIIHFIPSTAKHDLQYRIDFNRKKNGFHVYRNFWGDFQCDIIPCLPRTRISVFAQNQLDVLLVRRGNNHSRYNYFWSQNDSVKSPIDGKKLSNRNWKKIINNPKIAANQNEHYRYENGYFIDNSLMEFADSFRNYVRNYPQEAIELLLENNPNMNEIYIDQLWLGLSNSEMLNEIPNFKLELLIQKYGFNLEDYRANYICHCIENKDDAQWSDHIHDCLIEIVLNHKNPQYGSPIVYSNEDKTIRTADMLLNNALNCVRGSAARAIQHLLWRRNDLFEKFKEPIYKIACDENPVIRYAALWPLWPSYNISRDWAVETIFQIMEKDYRTIYFHDSRGMFCRTYLKKKDIIRKTLIKSLDSEEDNILQIAGFCIAELYMLHDDFKEYIENYSALKESVRKNILYMTINYFSIPKFRKKAKYLLLQFIETKPEGSDEFQWRRLFRDNLLNVEEDRDLIELLMSSGIKKKLLENVLEYLDINRARKKYATQILKACENIIETNNTDYSYYWGLETTLVKIIIGLYDEVKGSSSAEDQKIASLCLAMWDLMYQKDFGYAKEITNKFMNI